MNFSHVCFCSTPKRGLSICNVSLAVQKNCKNAQQSVFERFLFSRFLYSVIFAAGFLNNIGICRFGKRLVVRSFCCSSKLVKKFSGNNVLGKRLFGHFWAVSGWDINVRTASFLITEDI